MEELIIGPHVLLVQQIKEFLWVYYRSFEALVNFKSCIDVVVTYEVI